MSFRMRLSLALGAAVLGTALALGLGMRQQMRERLSAQDQRRVQEVLAAIHADLLREERAIASRLAELKRALGDDNRFRLALAQPERTDRRYVLDYAARAMRLSGLEVLQIQDRTGRILSSGHFRNAYGQSAPELARALLVMPDRLALARLRAPGDILLALLRSDSVRLGSRELTLVGGVTAATFLERLAPGSDFRVGLDSPGGRLGAVDGSRSGITRSTLDVPYLELSDPDRPRIVPARLVVSLSPEALNALLVSVDRWFYLILTLSLGAGLGLALWLSSRISRPLTSLAAKTAGLDLDRLDVEFPEHRTDEIGVLSSTLNRMIRRLRGSVARLREAEHRATIGDISRQVNHDIRNGLIPIRNVVRHLSRIAAERPGKLPELFAERRQTLDSSIGYLEQLAGNYARLGSTGVRDRCDLNELIRRVLRDSGPSPTATLRADLEEGLPPIHADPLALRRVLENLVANSVEALEGGSGSVVVSTRRVEGMPGGPHIRVTVADTGPGMTAEQRARIFEDFYTTKAEGTGLGLSIVRRLVSDMEGWIEVESEPGAGTRVVIDLPTAAGADAVVPDADAGDAPGGPP